MKRALSIFIAAITAIILSLTACAWEPEFGEGTDAVTITNVTAEDVAIAALYDESYMLIGVKTYKNAGSINISYDDIFDINSDAHYLKLFVWKDNMEPQMTAYAVDLLKHKNENAKSRDISIKLGGYTISAILADNSSADAFIELLKQGDVTVEMSDYGGFEKVGALPQSLPRNDERITTEPGDIILYQGNQITIYYDTNTWNFTRLGRINGLSQSELKSVLGSGSVTAVFSLQSHQN